MHHQSPSQYLEAGRSPYGIEDSYGLPLISGNRPAIVDQIQGKFKNDREAKVANTCMALAIPARARYADGDWRNDRRTLAELPVQDFSIEGLYMLVYAALEYGAKPEHAEPTVSEEIVLELSRSFGTEFSYHEFALLLREVYEQRLAKYILNEPLSAAPLDSEKFELNDNPTEQGHEDGRGLEEAQLYLRKPVMRSMKTLSSGHSMDDIALVDIAFDFIIEDIAWKKLKGMLMPTWLKYKKAKFPAQRFLPEVLVKFVTNDAKRFNIDLKKGTEDGLNLSEYKFMMWMIAGAAAAREKMFLGTG